MIPLLWWDKPRYVFKPYHLPGCQIWLAADLITGVADGAPLATWPDRSGQGNDMAQAVPANQPTYRAAVICNKPSVQFDGIGTFLSHAEINALYTNGQTVFVVARPDSGAHNQMAVAQHWGGNDGTSFLAVRGLGAIVRAIYTTITVGPVRADLERGSTPVGTPRIFEARYTNGVGNEMWIDAVWVGAAVAQAGVLQDTNRTVQIGWFEGDGGDWCWEGYISEVIVYDRALADYERARVERYLGRKYNIGMPTTMQFTANVGAGGSFDPSLTLAVGAPTPEWRVTDAAGTTVYNTAAIAHIQAGAGNMAVTLGPASLYRYITQIDANTDGLIGTLDAAWLRRMPALTRLYLYNNAALVCNWALADLPAGMQILHLGGNTASTITGTLADLPAGMTWLYLYATTSTITGALADLPAGMVNLYLYATTSTITGALADLPAGMSQLFLNSTSSTITGALADLPAGMGYLSLNNTTSAITGGVGAIAALGLQQIYLQSTGRTQAQVDEIISRIWNDKASFTYATPLLDIGGTNAAPTGIYQAVCPPTSGKERIYDLVNGNCTPGGPEWTVTYTP